MLNSAAGTAWGRWLKTQSTQFQVGGIDAGQSFTLVESTGAGLARGKRMAGGLQLHAQYGQ